MATTNKAQAPLAVRSILRGNPRVRLGATSGQQASATVPVQVDLNVGSNRYQLHHYGDVQTVPEPASRVKLKVALDPTATTGTGGGLVSFLNPYNARFVVVGAIVDVTTGVATMTWQLGYASTASGSGTQIVAATDTSLQSSNTVKAVTVVNPTTAIPVGNYIVGQVATVNATGLVANLILEGVLL